MAGKSRPAEWVPHDVFFLGRASIQELGDRFGPAGPLVFLHIIHEAKRAALGGAPVGKQGIVNRTYRSVARSAFLRDDTATVRAIVAACVEEELLELLSESTDKRMVVRLVKWNEWEPQDSSGARRQRRQD